MANKKISVAKLRKAIVGSGGLISEVAKRCGYSWQCTRDHIRANEELRALFEAEQDEIGDLAEHAVIEQIRKGDRRAAQWWLSRRRAERFGERLDVTTRGEALHHGGGLDDGALARLLELLAEGEARRSRAADSETDGA